MNMITADEETLLSSFETCKLPKGEFKHMQHVQVAWIILSKDPLFAALRRFRFHLKAFAVFNNVPDLYNETVTCFYLLLIHARMDKIGRRHSWDDFRVTNPDLFHPPKIFLETYYPKEAAFSSQAKSVFLLPETETAD